MDVAVRENVKNVVIPPSNNVLCEVCGITLDRNSMPSHLGGKKHLIKQQAYDKKHKTIFVSGSGNVSKENLKRIFTKFGVVTHITQVKQKSFSIIQFEDPSSVGKAVKERVFFNGLRLFVKKFQVVDHSPLPTKPPTPQAIADTQVGLPELPVELPHADQCPPDQNVFEWQVNQFISQVELEAEKYNQLTTVTADIEDILNPVLPGCKVLVFGSCNSTLALRNSDVDFFLQCAGLQPEDFVKNEAKQLYKKPQTLRVVTRIPKARVPIVKLQHVKTGLQCDLTANSKLGLCNSQLIKFLMFLDPRIKPLLLVIKYWSKVCGISGFGSEGFSAYSLVMLAIFYLQQLSPPLLPRIVDLQKLASDKDFSNGWICSFCDEDWKVKSELLLDQNESSLKDLLIGFFRFYKDFDYQNVICPFLGHKVPVSHFKDLDSLPLEMEQYKVNLNTDPVKNEFRTATMLRVQDPFELSLNITRNVTDKSFFMFKKGCEVSCDLSDEKDEGSLLGFLFSINKDSLYDGDQFIKISIGFEKNKDSNNTGAVLDSECAEWYDLEMEAILLVMREVLKVKVEPYSEEVVEKVKKTHSNQDLTTTFCSSEDLIYICSGSCDVINKRKKACKLMKKKLRVNLNSFEHEVCISSALLSNEVCPFSFILTISSHESLKKNKSIEVTISTKTDKNSKDKGYVKMLSFFMKHHLKVLTKSAIDFIVQTKASSPSNQVKGSLQELFNLRLAEIPDLCSSVNIDKNPVGNKDSLPSPEKPNKTLHHQSLLLKSIEKGSTRPKNSKVECTTTSKSLDNDQDQERETSQTLNVKEFEDQAMKSVLPERSMASAETEAIINEFLNPNHPDQVITLPLPNDTTNDNLSSLLKAIKNCETKSTFTSEDGHPLLESIDKIKLETLAFEEEQCQKNQVKTDEKLKDKKSDCKVGTKIPSNDFEKKKEYRKEEKASGKRCFPKEESSMESMSNLRRPKVYVEKHHKHQKPNFGNAQNTYELQRDSNYQRRYEMLESGPYREEAHFRRPHYSENYNNSYSYDNECFENTATFSRFPRNNRHQRYLPKPHARQ